MTFARVRTKPTVKLGQDVLWRGPTSRFSVQQEARLRSFSKLLQSSKKQDSDHYQNSFALQPVVIINQKPAFGAMSSPSITFVATSNRNLEIRSLVGVTKLHGTKALVRSGDAFKAAFKPQPSSVMIGKQQDKQDTPSILVVHGSGDDGVDIHPTNTGLVGTVVEAYNMHQNLQLRPDDIWIAILCQFSAYVNGRAEELRSKFVAHEGQKELIVNGVGNIYSADFAALTRRTLHAISDNIKDASLQEWFLPGFSTSTPTDDVCASATAMCSFQQYFKYTFGLCCGIPQVTLLGTLHDWKLLRAKVEKLLEFDTSEKLMTTWVAWLREICDNCVESREHGSATNLDFWDCIAHHSGGGSGPSYLSGWITVFSFFDEEGKGVAASNHWPVIDTDALNHNVASCPVKIEDNGVTYKSRLFVGQMGYETLAVSDESVTNVTSLGIVKQGGGPLVRLAPRNDWALVVYKE